VASSDEQRFWRKVSLDNVTCWLWLAGTDKGYGRFRLADRSRYAHHVAYEWTYGPVPRGWTVAQLCGNKRCVRPDHLHLVRQMTAARAVAHEVRTAKRWVGAVPGQVPLTHDLVALVDHEDWERVMQHSWHAKPGDTTWYAETVMAGRYVTLHRFLLEPPAGLFVDHISGDGLDNRRVNLRVATPGQSVANRRRPRNNTSGYKGVYGVTYKQGVTWVAQISCNNRTRRLGSYQTPEDAALAYDCAAQELFGEFARLNELPAHHERQLQDGG
jgi:hypothetical protein